MKSLFVSVSVVLGLLAALLAAATTAGGGLAAGQAPTPAPTPAPATTEFDPGISLTLNRFANIRTDVQLRVTFAPVSGAAAACTQSAEITVNIAFVGTVTETPASQAVRLIDDPGGQNDGCMYTATFPNTADNAVRISAETVTISATNPTASATYYSGTRINPSISVTLPEPASAFAGTEIPVTYTSTVSRCTTSATVTVRVAEDGTVAETAESQAVRLNSDRGTSVTCQYSVSFPATAGALNRMSGHSQAVNVGSPNAAATYTSTATFFDPDVALGIPNTAAAAVVGTEIPVTIAPAADADAACTQSATVTVVTTASGSVTETMDSQAVRLIDDPGPGAACNYVATFPATAGFLELDGDATDEISGTNSTAAAVYRSVADVFDPQISGALTRFDGFEAFTEIDVTITPKAGAAVACTQSATVTLLVQGDGSVTEIAASQSVRLIDNPGGGAAACVYTATFPDRAGTLLRRTSATVELSVASPAASATYLAFTFFDPVVSIMLPSSASALAGTEIDVMIAPVGGSNSLCTSSATVTVEVAPDGTASETTEGSAVTLLANPGSGLADCSYTATFPAMVGELRLATAATVTINSSNETASARYGIDTLFDPNITLSGFFDKSFYAGTEFVIPIVPKDGAPAACTQSATLTIRLDDNGDAVETTESQAVRLLDRPGGGSERCEYVLTLPARAGFLVLDTSPEQEISGNLNNRNLSYLSDVTLLNPSISLQFPAGQSGRPGPQDDGTEVAVTFTPVSNSHASCTQSATVTVRIGSNGSVTETSDSANVRLLDQPDRRSTDNRCSYTARFPADAGRFIRESSATDTISNTDTSASAEYRAYPRFHPQVDLTLPADATPYAGTEIEVQIVGTTVFAPLCQRTSATLTLRIGMDGTVTETPASQAMMLISRVPEAVIDCSYSATFPATAGALLLDDTDLRTLILHTSPTAAATYGVETEFHPQITIDVPNDPASFYAGTEFAVTIAPKAGAAAGCTQSATITLRVAEDGMVEETAASRSVMLVDDLIVVDRCEYVATFPAEAGLLRLDSNAEREFSGANPTANNPYRSSITLFNPEFSVTVLGDPGLSVAIAVDLAPDSGQHAGCTQSARLVVVANANGTFSEHVDSQDVRLVDSPAAGETYTYLATFPATASGVLRRSGNSVRLISSTNPTFEELYVRYTIFDPTITLSLPSPALGYAGLEFQVTIAPDSGEHPFCTQSATLDLRIGIDGSVEERTTDSQDLRLRDDPGNNVDRCEYLATFPTTIGVLDLDSDPEQEISGTDTTASNTYISDVSFFDPSPAVFTADGEASDVGTEIVVTLAPVAGSLPGCTQSAMLTYRVGATEVSETPDSQAVRLVDNPAARSGSVRCEYTATFPDEAGNFRRITPGTVTVSATTSPGATTYNAFPRFNPAISIILPTPAAQYAGTEFAVTFAPVNGSHQLCSPSATITVRVGSDGMTAELPDSQDVTLVDVPATSTTCAYRATFPMMMGALRLDQIDNDEVSEATPTAAVRYITTVTQFNPGAVLTLPMPASDYAGSEFVLMIAPEPNSDSGCTQSAMLTLSVDSNGNLSETTTSATVRLVDEPPSGSGDCHYIVTFPARVGQLHLTSAATARVSNSSVLVTATYARMAVSFDPQISVALRTGTAVPANTDIAVTFTPTAASSNPACTQRATVTVRVTPNGDVAETPAGAAVRLIDEPATGTGTCAYTARFPSAAGELRRTAGARSEVSKGSPSASANYAQVTRLDPQVMLTLPSPAADFAGTEIAVTLAPTAGSSNPGCTQMETVTLRIASNGTAAEVPASQSVRLINDPITGSGTCAYEATFPAEAGQLRRSSAATVQLTNSGTTAVATYVSGITRFDPMVDITVSNPADVDAAADIAVMFAPTPSSPAQCTQSATVTVRVAVGGAAAETTGGAAVRLIDDPALGSGTCAYTATFPATAGALRRTSGATVQVSESSATAAATYERPVMQLPTFDPMVSLTLPTPASAFAGTEFDVTFAPASGVTNPDCTQSATVTVRVAANGSVAETSASQSVRLVHDPALGSCAYSASFPATVGQLRRTSAASVRVSNGSRTAAATYAAAVTEFDPAVALTLPTPAADFAGTEFAVSFAPAAGAAAGCTQSATITVRVASNGSVSENSASQSVRLVDDPITSSTACSYTATFPAEAGQLRRTSPAGVTVSASSATAAATYASMTEFDPDVSLTLRASAASSAGLEFAVTFAPTAGAPAGCTQSATVTLKVNPDGSVEETTAGAAVTLVGNPGAAAACSYTATFPAAVGMLRRTSAATVEVSENSPAAAATYVQPVTEFDPSVMLTLPVPASVYAGTEFAVMFAPVAGSASDCTQSATVTVRIDSNGTAAETRASQAVRLVDEPNFISGPCSYTATFPAAAGGLRRTSAASVEVAEANPTAAATYESTATVFDPVVSITLPAPADVYAGTEFAVTFAPVAGAAADCTQSATVTVRVASNGSASETSNSQAVRLIDDPVSGSGACEYTASFPAVAGRLSRATAAEVAVSAASPRASATYAQTPTVPAPDPDPAPSVPSTGAATTFNPAVAITLPAPAAAYAGAEFAVTFAPTAASTNPGCTQSATVIAQVAADGSVSESAASQAVRLIDWPGSGVGTCAYAAAFPADAGVLRRSSAASVQVSAASPSAAATYGLITLDVVVTTSYPDDRVYTNADRATYEIMVQAPCVGYLGSTPSAFSVTGDTARVQVFPGTVQVFAPTMGRFGSGPKTFITNAFAGATADQPCTVTVTESGGPANCQAVSGNIQTLTYAAGLTALTFNFTHACSDAPVSSGSGSSGIQRGNLPAGWVALPFNGPTGTTPAAFAAQLSGAVTSLWVFDAGSQSWRGWRAGSSSSNTAALTSLTNGDTVMAFVPRAVNLRLNPADLLNPPAAAGTLSLPPGYSFQTFGGTDTVQLDTLLAGRSATAPLLFRWNSATQTWSYYLPDRQPLADYPLLWFNEISPGDIVFIFNARSSTATIPWS